MTDECRSDVRPCVEEHTDGPERMQPRPLPRPLNGTLTNHQFNFCLAFVQESRRLESALPTTDHHDSLPAKAGQLPVLRRMRCQIAGDARKLGRSRSKRTDPASNDDPPASHNFPVRQCHAEPRCLPFDFGDLTLLYVGNGMGLKPTTVGHKAIDGDGPTHTYASRSFERVDRQGPGGIGQLGCFPRRSQAHALGHIATPKRHGLTKDTDVHSVRIQMRGCRQPVRSSTDDRYVACGHKLSGLLSRRRSSCSF